MPKRFDTWFFVAAAPEGQIGAHDGSESVDSGWLGAQAALDDWEAKRRTIVFATRMQLVKLARADSVAAALANAAGDTIVDVMPVLDKTAPGEPHLRIPAEAGYGVTEVPVSRIGMYFRPEPLLHPRRQPAGDRPRPGRRPPPAAAGPARP